MFPSCLQVRRSFLQELEVHNNWSVVDMLFREFYTGSDRDLAPDEKAALEEVSKLGRDRGGRCSVVR